MIFVIIHDTHRIRCRLSPIDSGMFSFYEHLWFAKILICSKAIKITAKILLPYMMHTDAYVCDGQTYRIGKKGPPGHVSTDTGTIIRMQ